MGISLLVFIQTADSLVALGGRIFSFLKTRGGIGHQGWKPSNLNGSFCAISPKLTDV